MRHYRGSTMHNAIRSFVRQSFAFIAVNVFKFWNDCFAVCVSDLYIVNALWLLLYRIFSAFTREKKREKNNWFVVTQQQYGCACNVAPLLFLVPIVWFISFFFLLLSITLWLALFFVLHNSLWASLYAAK